MKYMCNYCGKEFTAKKSSKRKYCSKSCANENSKGKSNQRNTKEKILVKCKICGKEEFKTPSRAKYYHTCSKECRIEYSKINLSKKIECKCSICGKIFKVKPFIYNRVKSKISCSRKCASQLKETSYIGKNNHQYGLKGKLNSSFVGDETTRRNSKITDIFVYRPERPDANKDGRIAKHRLIIQENYDKFNNDLFDFINGFAVLKDGLNVHHINQDHNDNSLDNLIPVTRAQHIKIHTNCRSIAQYQILRLIGVFKQGKLLETPGVDNQQPSLNSNVFEGSETNDRLLSKCIEESNVDTTTLLENVIDILNEYIVQTTNITKEIVESKIKNLEVITNGLSQ